MKYAFLIVILFLLVYPIEVSIDAGVTAEDWNRLGVWVNDDLTGAWTPLSTYLPTFLVFMMPFVLLSNVVGVSIAWFQVVLFSLATGSLLYITNKFHGFEPMFALSIIMMSCLLFSIWTTALIPQTLDIILFSGFMYFYFNKKYPLATALLVLLGYNHLFGVIFFLITFVFSALYRREFIKFWIVALILCIPAIALYDIPMFFGMRNFTAETPNIVQTEWQIWNTPETLYFSEPLHILMFSGFLIPAFIYALYKWRKQFKLDDYQKFYLIWALCFIPTAYFCFFRTWTFLIIPMMLFAASAFQEVKE
jgi:hypothetical protein